MKFLVTGSTGLVGSQVVKELIKQKHVVYSCYNESFPQDGIQTKLDLVNQNDIKDTLNEIQPDIVIHLGAMTNVDLCEKDQLIAKKIILIIQANFLIIYFNLIISSGCFLIRSKDFLSS